MDIVQLSRLQFGLTAMYHFLFVPLTLGLSVLLVIMESIYVTTGRNAPRRSCLSSQARSSGGSMNIGVMARRA
jgi:hypothetical protein